MAKFSSLKRTKIYKKYENGVEVYNPTPKQQLEIIKIFENVNKKEDFKISGRDLLLKFFPMLTNIELDLEDKQLIDEILSDPSDTLKEVAEAITDIVSKIVNRTIRAADHLAKLPKKTQKEILQQEKDEKVTISKAELERLKSLDK